MIAGRKRIYENSLDIPEGRSGRVSVSHVIRPAGVPILMSTMRTALFGQRVLPDLVFDHPTRWHMLQEDRRGVWMSDLPIEQRQIDDMLLRYSGRVLVGGLGLGYAVAALAAKRAVREIVVVEKSQDVIKLVWPHVRDGAKGRVVCGDLFAFLRETNERFDRGFFDIWQGDGETTFHNVVVPLRKLAHVKVRRVDCWNEDVMRGQLRMGLDSRLLFVYNDVPGASECGISIEKLATINGSIYTDWAVPFWRWVQRDKPSLEDAQQVAQVYASVYGIPNLEPRLHAWGLSRVA